MLQGPFIVALKTVISTQHWEVLVCISIWRTRSLKRLWVYCVMLKICSQCSWDRKSCSRTSSRKRLLWIYLPTLRDLLLYVQVTVTCSCSLLFHLSWIRSKPKSWLTQFQVKLQRLIRLFWWTWANTLNSRGRKKKLSHFSQRCSRQPMMLPFKPGTWHC